MALVTSVLVQKETGGNLAEIFGQICRSSAAASASSAGCARCPPKAASRPGSWRWCRSCCSRHLDHDAHLPAGAARGPDRPEADRVRSSSWAWSDSSGCARSSASTCGTRAWTRFHFVVGMRLGRADLVWLLLAVGGAVCLFALGISFLVAPRIPCAAPARGGHARRRAARRAARRRLVRGSVASYRRAEGDSERDSRRAARVRGLPQPERAADLLRREGRLAIVAAIVCSSQHSGCRS